MHLTGHREIRLTRKPLRYLLKARLIDEEAAPLGFGTQFGEARDSAAGVPIENPIRGRQSGAG
jgi:hypothetical protein